MNLFYRNNYQVRDGGPIDPPCDGKLEAIEEEFERLIRDPETLEKVFDDGLPLDAVTGELLASLADSRKPSVYEAVAKRIEKTLRWKVYQMAQKNIKEGAL